MSIWFAAKNLCNRDFDQNTANLVPGFKLFENFGEAVPQFVIAIVFYSQNYTQLPQLAQAFFWVSMLLSFGSILFGLANGIASRGKCMEWLQNSPSDIANELAYRVTV